MADRARAFPPPHVEVREGAVHLTDGSLAARVDADAIRFGHLGCRLLGSVKTPPALAARWDLEFGGRSRWKAGAAVARLAHALAGTARAAATPAVALWDTMRKGSDYWRPGRLLREVAEELASQPDAPAVHYGREDLLAPSMALLEAFRAEHLPYGDFAQRYCEELHGSGAIGRAAAAVVLELARGRLPLFYCADPYVPGYGDPARMARAGGYRERPWLAELPSEGCHRVVLAEEVARWFLARGVPVALFEVDQLSEHGHHLRRLSPGRPAREGSRRTP